MAQSLHRKVARANLKFTIDNLSQAIADLDLLLSTSYGARLSHHVGQNLSDVRDRLVVERQFLKSARRELR